MIRTRARCSGTGFTLIELLIVISLGALVSMAVYSMFASAVSVNRRIAQGFFDEEADIFFEKIDRELSSQVPYQGIPFEGNSLSLKFAARMAPDPARPMDRGVGEVWYGYDDSAGAFVRQQRNLSDVFLENKRESAALLKDVEDVNFQYFVFNTQNQLYEWTDEWNSAEQKDQIPAAVRVRVNCKRGEERYAYQRTIAVPLASSTR